MAYAVDKAIREQGMRIAMQQEGDNDGGSWLSSKAAQRMSLAEPEAFHCREQISKFGGMIKVGTAVAIPKQTWNRHAVKPLEDSYHGRHTASHVIVHNAIPGYKGHRPNAPQWSLPQRRADLESPYIKPMLEAAGIPTDTYDASPSRTYDRASLTSISVRPKAWRDNLRLATTGMPVPGYAGHLPLTKGNATENFGTSFFRMNKPFSRHAEAAHARAQAYRYVHPVSPVEREQLSC